MKDYNFVVHSVCSRKRNEVRRKAYGNEQVNRWCYKTHTRTFLYNYQYISGITQLTCDMNNIHSQ